MSVEEDDVLYQEFQVLRGISFTRTIKLWKDSTEKVPLPFTGVTFSLVLDGYITLTDGHGLALDIGGSNLEFTLSAEQSENAPKSQHEYHLEIVENADPTNNKAPMRGVFTFEPI